MNSSSSFERDMSKEYKQSGRATICAQSWRGASWVLAVYCTNGIGNSAVSSRFDIMTADSNSHSFTFTESAPFAGRETFCLVHWICEVIYEMPCLRASYLTGYNALGPWICWFSDCWSLSCLAWPFVVVLRREMATRLNGAVSRLLTVLFSRD